jgi:hypothetical protein
MMAKLKPENTLRFAWWAAEELGLLGSADYVAGLSAAERDRIALYMNYDMVGSPNYIFRSTTPTSRRSRRRRASPSRPARRPTACRLSSRMARVRPWRLRTSCRRDPDSIAGLEARYAEARAEEWAEFSADCDKFLAEKGRSEVTVERNRSEVTVERKRRRPRWQGMRTSGRPC